MRRRSLCFVVQVLGRAFSYEYCRIACVVFYINRSSMDVKNKRLVLFESFGIASIACGNG